MLLKDKFRFVRQNMKKNKTRVFMTVLATAIGCAFLIVLASVGFGLQKSVIADITERGVVTEIEVHGKDDGNHNYLPITDKHIKELEGLDKVKAVKRQQMLRQSPEITYGEFKGQTSVVAVHFPSEVKAGMELANGRMPSADDEVVVGYHFYEALAKGGRAAQPDQAAADENAKAEAGSVEHPKPDELLGKTMEMHIVKYKDKKELRTAFPMKIVGIAKAPSREWQRDQSLMMGDGMMEKIEAYTGTKKGMFDYREMPGEQRGEGPDAKLDADGERTYERVGVQASNMKNVKAIQAQMKSLGYASHSIANQIQDVNAFFLIFKIGLILVGTIALLIASIGIYNTMTMAVTERAQDIGIMKAVGAHPRTIKGIFLIESSCIGFMGAVIGTAAAYVVSSAVNLILPAVLRSLADGKGAPDVEFSYIPVSLTLLCVAISIGVAVLSGWRPAMRATRVDVLKALRRDI